MCAALITWGYPVLMFSWKIGMAIATGNTLILKPAEEVNNIKIIISIFSYFSMQFRLH